MTLLPTPEWMQPPRLEISSPGRDADGRRVFHLVFHDHGPSIVWRGESYAAAILAAEAYEQEGVEVVDTVVDDNGMEGPAHDRR